MNRRRFISLLCLVLLGAAAGGCAVADTGAFVRLQEDMESLKREVAAGRGSPAPGPPPAAALGQKVEEMQAKVARLAEVEKRVAALEEKAGRGAAGKPPGADPQVPLAGLKAPEEVCEYGAARTQG